MLIKICELFIGTSIILDNKNMSVLTLNHIYKFPSGIHCYLYIKSILKSTLLEKSELYSIGTNYLPL